MSGSLTVEYVPIRTAEDRRLFDMAIKVLGRMVAEIILEMRAKEEGSNGDISVGTDRVNGDRPGDIRGSGFSEVIAQA